jgi:hypothetical protein
MRGKSIAVFSAVLIIALMLPAGAIRLSEGATNADYHGGGTG